MESSGQKGTSHLLIGSMLVIVAMGWLAWSYFHETHDSPNFSSFSQRRILKHEVASPSGRTPDHEPASFQGELAATLNQLRQNPHSIVELNAKLKNEVFREIGQSHDESFIPALKETLTSENQNDRALAVEALAQLQSPAAADELIRLYQNDPEDQIHLGALSGLLRQNSRNVVQDTLTYCLKNETSPLLKMKCASFAQNNVDLADRDESTRELLRAIPEETFTRVMSAASGR